MQSELFASFSVLLILGKLKNGASYKCDFLKIVHQRGLGLKKCGMKFLFRSVVGLSSGQWLSRISSPVSDHHLKGRTRWSLMGGGRLREFIPY